MSERPTYRVIVEGQRHFSCEPLRATLSTHACAERHRTAGLGDSCRGCSVGYVHALDHAPAPKQRLAPGEQDRRLRRPERSRVCLRCGRCEVRLVVSTGVCVSCTNRESEWRKGRNRKGRAPITYKPLHDRVVALQHQDGAIEHRLLEVAHLAEAIGRVLRDMPDGARLVRERQLTALNRATREFERVCPNCGAAGLVLERRRGVVLERHAWCCGGWPGGHGWQLAKVRQPVMGMHPDEQAALLDGAPELAGEIPGVWTALPAWCAACAGGQLMGLLSAADGKWRTGCSACGANSKSAEGE